MSSLNYKGFVYTNFKLLSNLHVEESAYISSNVDIFGILTVNNDAYITGQLDVSNNVTVDSNLTVLQGISGDGSNITHLHADNINQGTLLVPFGGTGKNAFTANKLLSGNSTDALQEVTDLHWDSNNSYLGIKTSSPSYTLDVTGDFHVAQGAVIDGQLECLNGFSGDGSNLTNLDMDNATLGTLIVGRGGTGKTTLGANKVLLGNGTGSIQDDVDLHFDTSNKRLGIKTASPDYTLDVSGTMHVNEATQMDGKVTMDSNLEVLGNTRVHGDLIVDGTKTTMNTDVKVTDQFLVVNDGTGPALEVNQIGDMPIAHFKDDSNIVMTIADNGLVGIGVENPTEKLHVVGNALIESNVYAKGELEVDSAATFKGTLDVQSAATLSNALTVEGSTTLNSDLSVMNAADFGSTLDVSGSAGFSNTLTVSGATILNSTLNVTSDTTLESHLTVSNGITGDGSNISNLDVDNVASGVLDIQYGGTGQNALTQNKLLVGAGTSGINAETSLHYDGANGYLGIGKTNPGYTLDVNGSFYVSGATTFDSGVDVASAMDVSSNLTVSGSIIGDGSNITNIDVNNVSKGVLDVQYGGTGNNSLTSNKVLMGNGQNAITAEANLHYDVSESRLGVNTASPQSTLDVSGDMHVTGAVTLDSNLNLNNSITLSDGYTINTQNDLGPTEIVQKNDNIGISVSDPQYTLDVGGTFHVISNSILDGSLQVGSGITGDGSNITHLNVDNVASGILDVQYGGTGQNALTSSKLLVGNGTSAVNAESDLHFDTGNTRLGIAQAAPLHTLDVNGSMRVVNGAQFESAVAMSNTLTVSQDATVQGTLSVLSGISGDGSNVTNLDVNNVSAGTLDVQYGGTGKTTLTASKVLLGNGTSGIQDESDLHFDTANNRLGINTASPSYTLDVNGVLHATSNAIFDTDINVAGSVILSDGTALDSSDDLRPSELLQKNLNIGIGTQNPNYKLDVSGDMRVTNDATFQSQVIVQNGISGDGSNITNLDVNNVSLGILDVQYGGTGQNSLTANKILVGSGTSGVSAETNLHYDSTNSYLGIGMTNPSHTLDISGNFHVTSAATFDSGVDVSGSVTVSAGISGDGSNITNLDVDNVALGILDVQYGGTGNNSLTSEKVLLGNGQSPINAEGDLHFNVAESRLGINTTTPGYSLDVSGDARVTGAAFFDSNITVNESIILATDGYTITTQNDLRPSQLVQENNKIGINQTNPNYDLDVGGTFHTSGDSLLDGSLDVNGGITGDGSNITNLDVDNVSLGVLDVQYGGTGDSNLTTDHVLIGNGTGKMVDDANLFFDTTNDRLAVGHTSPGYTLDVNGTIYGSNNFYWSGSRLGIGTITPQYELDVQGTIYASEDVQYASDRRIKTDIQPIDNVLDRMAGVRGHKFRRTDLGEDKKDAYHIGFIAQELREVVPECVGYSKDIDQYHVSYGNMVALLAEAFHNVHDRLTRLEKECGKN